MVGQNAALTQQQVSSRALDNLPDETFSRAPFDLIERKESPPPVGYT